MACTSCRDRKVKCDGGLPSCQRCSRYSVHCVYMPPSRQSRVDVDLMSMNDRLLQAETALAAQQDGSSRAYPPIVSQSISNNESTTWPNSIPSVSTFSPTEISQFFQHSSSDPPATSSSLQETNAFPLNDPVAWDISNMMATDIPEACGTSELFAFGGEKIDTSDKGYSSESLSQWPSADSSSSSDQSRIHTARGTRIDAYETVPQNVMKDLYRRYFDAIHPSIPMIDESRSPSSTDDIHVPLESLGLRYAMWAHAAALSPIYSNLKERFYQQARECVEDSEVEVSGGSMTIAALQTHILLALYEFKETLFPRAWTSVSRATWLAQMLELHKMDPKVSSKPIASFETYLHETSDPAELKERATTLWAAYGLHCFIGVGVGWNTGCMLDVREITTHIPAHDSYVNAFSRSLTLKDALSLPATWVLSPYQGMVVMANICICCLSHVKQLQREKLLDNFSYDFWTEHHHLDETIQYASTNSLAHLVAADFVTEPNVLSLNIILQATIICLHQAVIAKAGRTNTSARHIPRSEDECIKAATELSAMMRLVTRANVVKMNPLIPWAIYVALQVIFRRSQRKSSVPDNQASSVFLARPPRGNDSPTSSRHTSGKFKANAEEQADESLNDAKALDSMHFLLSTLMEMRVSNPLAKVLEGQISQEMAEGRAMTRERVVGLVNFPLAHPSTRSGEGGNEMDTSFQA